jgi:hypothetical protein
MTSPYQEHDHLINHNQKSYGKEEEQKEGAPPSSNRGHLSFRAAGLLILLLLSIALFYHVLIITRVVAYEKVWGGRLTSDEQMYRFESISIVVNLLILVVAVSRLAFKSLHDNKSLSIFCWIFTALYALNTVGNIFAQTKFERIVFTPLTLLLSISFARLALGEQDDAE